MQITNDIRYIGVNDHEIDLFEGQYTVPNGMAYNSYAILDNKIAVMDTVDRRFTHEWLDNLAAALDGRQPDYLIVQHMEPDHSANILQFMTAYPAATVVSSAKAFQMMQNFFGTAFEDRRVVVGEGDTLTLGRHTLTFVGAPMVHWPEVIVTYDSADKVLFSADGFGKFGALDVEEDWACEARRYYFGIVGKYGAQVQALLKKAAGLDIAVICPLHGPVLSDNLGYYLNLYNTWSSYGVESDGIVIAYTSVYGNTKKAVELLAEKLKAKGCPKVAVTDLARDDMAEAVEDAFRYGRLVLATTTYNAEIFPFMRTFIEALVEHGYQNRTVALIENGSWAPQAAKVMRGLLEKAKNITFAANTVSIRSALSDDSAAQLEALANELCQDYLAQHDETANKNDLTALFKIGYGLYV
ncbi:MAG: FprA family A-type flavoprotein, partial [Acutalibacteraceae bacterium]